MAKAHANVKVQSLNTEWAADNAYKMVLDAFTQNPDIKGVFSHNDEMVRGIVSALRQIGKLVPPGEPGHVVVIGLDGTAGARPHPRGNPGCDCGAGPLCHGRRRHS